MLTRAAALAAVCALAACAPIVDSATPAMVEVRGFGLPPRQLTEAAQQRCRENGRDAVLRSERQEGGWERRVFECVAAR